MSTSLNTQLIEATKAGDDPLARHLIYLGADVNTPDPADNISSDAPLVWALRNNNFQLINTLIHFQADPTSLFTDALRFACKDGDLQAVKALIRHGAQITQENLDSAQMFNHQHILDWLKEFQAKTGSK